MKRMVVAVLVAFCMSVTIASVFAQAAPAAPAATPARPPAPAPAPAAPAAAPKPTDAQRRTDLENKLKSGNKAQIDAAYAGYKDWIAEDGKAGEMHFYMARELFAPLADHALQTLELVNIARKHKTAVGTLDMAYVNVMEAQALYQLGRDADAQALLDKSLKDEPEVTADEIRRTLVTALTPLKKQRDALKFLEKALATGPGDSDTVEGLLKQRLTVCNGLKDYPAALSCAKALFNASSMAHTSDAITLLDRQFLLPNMDDRSKVDQFRQEQTIGAAPIGPGQPARPSALVQAIKIDPAPYQAALAKMTDDATAKAITRHVLLLLVADKPKEALEAAKQALAIAADPKEMAVANELIARCYKAQDGTIGRANGWIAANPK
jgi:tetratricopeptide (TPR) repeat protein